MERRPLRRASLGSMSRRTVSMFMCVLQVRCLQWRDGQALAQLVADFDYPGSCLIVLEVTGGFEITMAAVSGRRRPAARGRKSTSDPRFARATGRRAKIAGGSLRPALSRISSSDAKSSSTVARRKTRLRRPKNEGIRLDHHRQLRGMMHDGRGGRGGDQARQCAPEVYVRSGLGASWRPRTPEP